MLLGRRDESRPRRKGNDSDECSQRATRWDSRGADAPALFRCTVLVSFSFGIVTAREPCIRSRCSPLCSRWPRIPNPAQPQSPIRVDVNLVEVDAVVTNARGRHVTDLPSSAFEIFPDGKQREIKNFYYISSPSASGSGKTATRTQPKLGSRLRIEVTIKDSVPVPTRVSSSALTEITEHGQLGLRHGFKPRFMANRREPNGIMTRSSFWWSEAISFCIAMAAFGPAFTVGATLDLATPALPIASVFNLKQVTSRLQINLLTQGCETGVRAHRRQFRIEQV